MRLTILRETVPAGATVDITLPDAADYLRITCTGAGSCDVRPVMNGNDRTHNQTAMAQSSVLMDVAAAEQLECINGSGSDVTIQVAPYKELS